MKIELRRLVDIIPYKQNARKIPQRAIDKVALSLKEFGWQQPIVIDKKGVIVAGHTRWLPIRPNTPCFDMVLLRNPLRSHLAVARSSLMKFLNVNVVAGYRQEFQASFENLGVGLAYYAFEA